ncbi:MAG TPA: RNA polymerase sigma factor [Thermoanaerobaculia bacterium]|nr:RNA polymerase sigma factor [Thermoanaerobaculia bacterium]
MRRPPEPAAAEDPDWPLLSRAVDGDERAFAGLVERHQERILRTCERLLGRAAEAEEAAQEVFLKLFRRGATFRPQGQLSTLLYRIAVNHCLNLLRRRKVLRFLRLEGEGEETEAPRLDPHDGRAGPHESLEARQRWREVRRAIDRLPENQRSVLVLARFEGLSYREIAEVLGITLGAVESRLVRAMRNLEVAQEKGGAGVSGKGTRR